MAHSLTGDFVSVLILFRVYEHIKPNSSPVKIDQSPRELKSLAITKVDEAVNSVSWDVYLTTVWNKIMDTASFVIPSPKTRLKSFGFSAGLISDTAAITSVEQSRDHIRRTSKFDRFMMDFSPVTPSSIIMPRSPKIFSRSDSLYQIVIAEKLAKAINVPIRPNRMMFLIFWKNFLRCMLNPEANTIGGRQK